MAEEQSDTNLDAWKEELHTKLVDIFQDDIDSLMRIFHYLDEEENAYKNDTKVPPASRRLKLSMGNDVAFKKYAEMLAEDTRKAEKDEVFRKTMDFIYSRMAEASEEPLPEEFPEDDQFDFSHILETNFVNTIGGSMGLMRAWTKIPFKSQVKIIRAIAMLTRDSQLMVRVKPVGALVNKVCGRVALVSLAAVSLTIEAIRSLFDWWNGKITGIRCCKNIIDSAVSIAAGCGGAIGGAATGAAVAGPIGGIVGGLVGGVVSASAANYLSDRLTQKLFGIPKEVALENAYSFFGTKITSPNNEINMAYRRKCLEFHPDKGGKPEDFHIVQVNMGVIKVARGEPY